MELHLFLKNADLVDPICGPEIQTPAEGKYMEQHVYCETRWDFDRDETQSWSVMFDCQKHLKEQWPSAVTAVSSKSRGLLNKKGIWHSEKLLVAYRRIEEVLQVWRVSDGIWVSVWAGFTASEPGGRLSPAWCRSTSSHSWPSAAPLRPLWSPLWPTLGCRWSPSCRRTCGWDDGGEEEEEWGQSKDVTTEIKGGHTMSISRSLVLIKTLNMTDI